MNRFLDGADRRTHIKTVVVALCAAVAAAGLALSFRDASGDGSVHAERLIKAGKPVVVTNSVGAVVRWRL
jgi:hypothetical protein